MDKNEINIDIERKFKWSSGTQDLLKRFGFSNEKAHDLTEDIYKLAIDFADFHISKGVPKQESEVLIKSILGVF